MGFPGHDPGRSGHDPEMTGHDRRNAQQELRIDHGPGYRVYLSRRDAALVLLLCASDKSRQDAAIARAIEYLKDWERRG
jgi:putative addiction module killer protein